MKKVAAVILLLVGFAGVVVGKPKDKAPCKVFFVMVEQDEITVNLKMVGLNKQQNNWYKKDGNQKEYAGVCLVHANESGEQIALESGSEEYINRTVGDSPLYLVAWEEHKVFVPDKNGGHYAYSANGTLSKWRPDSTKPDGGNFVPVGPVHDTNRTILSFRRPGGAQLTKMHGVAERLRKSPIMCGTGVWSAIKRFGCTFRETAFPHNLAIFRRSMAPRC